MKIINKRNISFLYLVFSFGFLDVWLRVNTRWINAYSIYEIIPNTFTLAWAFFLALTVSLFTSRVSRRILFAVLYYLAMIFVVVQYGAYLCLGKFLYISDFMYADEGTDYLKWVFGYITPSLILQIVALISMGIIGILLSANVICCEIKKHRLIHVLSIGICVTIIIVLPFMYHGDAEESDEWNAFQNPSYEYQQFSNPNFDMQLTGMYQFINRNAQVMIKRNISKNTDEINFINDFFAEKNSHNKNDMTGIFKDKNLIVIMMESIDDWMITAEHTPTLYEMKQSSMDFEEFYTPQYSNGYTFNTEFAFNSSIYPYSNGNVAYSLPNNMFSDSLASIMNENGYESNSFHQGQSTFYNRGQMHQAWGYKRYYSYYDYPETDVSVVDDRFLYMCDELYRDITAGERFFSFVITMTPHLPYNDEDELSQYALSVFPEYDVQEEREINILRAKARITDEMFKGLLARLEEDGLLKDTVIVCFSDHYAYGLTDHDVLQKYSEEAGSIILERTAAFIYSSELEERIAVDKVMQTVDLAPTLLNLFGYDVPKEIIGHDIFDDGYAGYAIFPNNTWITSEAYMKNGQLIYNNGMSEEEIGEMNIYSQNIKRVNDAILYTDYYRYMK